MTHQLSTLTHTLTIVIEPEEGAWHAYCPTLLDYGAATWGATREEALAHLREMLNMLLERLAQRRVVIPAASAGHMVAAGQTEQLVITIRMPAM
jgi:predicted RNase H-like HicB family nuclease